MILAFAFAPATFGPVAAHTAKERVLYSFAGGNDCGGPFSGLTADALGNLYGTTFAGGDDFDGTVFKLRIP
jgi:hypothetical protein